MASWLRTVRFGVAIVGAMLLPALSTTAAAEPTTGTVRGETVGYHVNVGKGKLKEIVAKLNGLELSDGTEFDMYCVEVRTALDHQHEMVEKPWDEFPNPSSPFHDNRDRINWVLHNSYPVTSRDAVEDVLDERGVTLHNGLSVKEAISATQAAVWHFSDGVDLNRKNPLPVVGKKHDADVLALYDYLVGDDNVGIGEQPAPALEVGPTELSGVAGEPIGPFTVTTSGAVAELSADLPDGVRITDADGAELDGTAIEDGTELYLDVPADAAAGEATFDLTAKANMDTGRLFVGENYAEKKTQSLIVAKSARTEITVSAGATWTAAAPPTTGTTAPPSSETTAPPTTPTTSTTEAAPVPQPKNTAGLAETGASILTPVVIGVVLVGAGVGALLFLRHRRRV